VLNIHFDVTLVVTQRQVNRSNWSNKVPGKQHHFIHVLFSFWIQPAPCSLSSMATNQKSCAAELPMTSNCSCDLEWWWLLLLQRLFYHFRPCRVIILSLKIISLLTHIICDTKIRTGTNDTDLPCDIRK
jgi:hypothetical protein